jgi:hypothetical protein
VGDTPFLGIFLRLLSSGSFAGRAEVDELSHAWWGLSNDVAYSPPQQAHLVFANVTIRSVANRNSNQHAARMPV